MLDQLAEKTPGAGTYVRPAEDIETKVSGLYGKISNPVLTNLKLTATQRRQVQRGLSAGVAGPVPRQSARRAGPLRGKGPAAIKLTGQVGKEAKEFVYEVTFPDKTGDEREFVEHLWARRKVGYLLDQIRANGEKKELVEEVVTLAKKYGITTPYTSYLVVPDGPMPVVRDPRMRPLPGRPMVGFGGGMGMGGGMMGMGGMPAGLAPMGPTGKPIPVLDFAKQNQAKPGELAQNRGERADKDLKKADGKGTGGKALERAPRTEVCLRSRSPISETETAERRASR